MGIYLIGIGIDINFLIKSYLIGYLLVLEIGLMRGLCIVIVIFDLICGIICRVPGGTCKIMLRSQFSLVKFSLCIG